MEVSKVYDFDPRNLPQELLSAIGLMTTSAAQTEGCIEAAIAGCLGTDFEYGKAITTHMAAPLRDSVLRSVAEIKINDLDALDSLDGLLDTITKHTQNEMLSCIMPGAAIPIPGQLSLKKRLPAQDSNPI